jgi:hypothetical protein
MADINGTSGNDTLQPFGNSLALTLSGTIAEGIRPIINVLVNGSVVLSNVTITADANAGATQVVTVPMPAGAVSSIDIQYTNDDQVDSSQDRNLVVSQVSLNGHALPVSAVTYTRLAGGQFFDTLTGQQWLNLTGGAPIMKWGGTLDLSGTAVTSATPVGTGSLSVDGGGGIDTVLLGGIHGDYSISQSGTGYTVTNGAASQTLNLANVERLHFAAGNNVALDTGADGHAGLTAEILAVLFGAAAVNNASVMGIGISLLDQGVSALQLVAAAESTALFKQLAGSSSNADFVTLLFHNLVGAAPSAQQLSTFVGLLDSGSFTQPSLGLAAAQTGINQAHLVGVVQSGVEFI